MSEQVSSERASATSRTRKWAIVAVAVALALIAPLYIDAFWLQAGFVVAGAAVGAIGLNIVVGTTGLLSFAHPVFLATGACVYTVLAAEPDEPGLLAASVPPVVSAILAVGVAGVIGFAFGPIAARLGGIYLGIATLGVIFIGQHILENWQGLSGGFFGRPVPDFSVGGFNFSGDAPEFAILGVPIGRDERLWYLGLAILVLAAVIARNIVASRPGRALTAVRDSEIMAAVNGVDSRLYKQGAFVISAMFGAASGVMYALSVGNVSPESFTVAMAIQFLAMIVIGGLGSVVGSCLGAVFVIGLPLIMQEYAAGLPLITETGSTSGISAATASTYLFGISIIACLILEPRGLAGLARRMKPSIRAI